MARPPSVSERARGTIKNYELPGIRDFPSSDEAEYGEYTMQGNKPLRAIIDLLVSTNFFGIPPH